MPTKAVRPRPSTTVCCGGNIIIDDMIKGKGSNPSPPVTDSFLLLENGDYVLLEDGSKIILE